jgi:hypothetical protein
LGQGCAEGRKRRYLGWRSEAQSLLNHPDRKCEVTFLVSVYKSMAPDLSIAGVAAVAPGTGIDLGSTVGSAGDFDVVGDVLHDDFSFVIDDLIL